MKKYIKPAIATVKIDNQAILAGSDKNQYDAGAGGSTDNVGAKGGLWEDED